MLMFDVQDQRKIGDSVKITIDEAKLFAVAEAADLPTDVPLEVRIRIRDVNKSGTHAYVERVGKNCYRVVLHVLPKAKLSKKALYVLNNSILHEFRHIAQFETFGVVAATMMADQLEEEALEYGRKARLENLGTSVWSLS